MGEARASDETRDDGAFSRRSFMAKTAVAGAAALLWRPAFRIEAAAAAGDAPPSFPVGIPLYRVGFENWAKAIKVDDLWTCAPRDAADVALLANWARANGWRLRPRGRMHGWSPLSVTPGMNAEVDRVLMVDTTASLTAMTLVPGTPTAVRVGAGALMEDLLRFAGERGFGVTTVPAPGDITVGGALAIDGHGAALPAAGEAPTAGKGFGSLSNLVLSLTAVVWDRRAGAYVVRTFDRSHPHTKALLTHLGRAFLTEVTLQVGPDANLRCESSVDIPAAELFGQPGSASPLGALTPARTFAGFLDAAGRVEAIWYPFTDNPWLKVWSVAPSKPSTSREVTTPYNYPFSDNVPDELAALADQIVTGHPEVTREFGSAMYAVTAAGLAATAGFDLWGASRNVLLYIKPTTLRVTANGYAVITRRSNVQKVVADFREKYLELVAAYEARGQYPMSMPVEIRATGLDQSSDVVTSGAEPPALSALSPRADHPEWDVAVWFDILTFADTPHAAAFYRDIEEWMFSRCTNGDSCIRPEWSKGWAYTADGGGWTDQQMITSTIPDLYRVGRNRSNSWDWARSVLNTLDPARLYSNELLDQLLP